MPVKKVDYSNCDNWRGIFLLDVAGKMVVRILQAQLQKLRSFQNQSVDSGKAEPVPT